MLLYTLYVYAIFGESARFLPVCIPEVRGIHLYLKAIEIQGFKSFADKTRLTFERDITAIVGPNGAGKSNLSDAILWVMGEQRTRTLRGGKMEDVIFGGTEKRGSMGFAQVSLILDNSAGLFPIEQDEVVITRRYYRSGDSEYYINRESCRLRDIHELLMDTGLGRDGYSIIGQGRIAEIVGNKSTDRREIFEEAAGISRYRYRKEESERKLARTDENLLRINDKVDELELQIEPLRNQAAAARKYLDLRADLKDMEVSVWMETLDRLKVQNETVQRDYAAAQENLEGAQRELDRLYAESESIAGKMREQDVQAETLRERVSEAERMSAAAESEAAVLRANLSTGSENIARMRLEVSEQSDRVQALHEQIDASRARLDAITDEKRKQLEKEESIVAEIERNTADSGAADKAFAEVLERENAAAALLAERRTAITMLADQSQSLRSGPKRSAPRTRMWRNTPSAAASARRQRSRQSTRCAKRRQSFRPSRSTCVPRSPDCRCWRISSAAMRAIPRPSRPLCASPSAAPCAACTDRSQTSSRPRTALPLPWRRRWARPCSISSLIHSATAAPRLSC